MKDRETIERPTKSGWARKRPVSSTATLMPWPVDLDAAALVAIRPQVWDGLLTNPAASMRSLPSSPLGGAVDAVE
jgi:hypothetical protein